MKEEDFLGSLRDLTGKVAVVVGGTQGIGQSTTVYLALRGATVYACAPDIPREHDGMDEASKKVAQRAAKDPRPGTIHFHALDLASVQGARSSAINLEKRLKAEGGRLDILVNNAGIANTKADLSPDGFERTFAVNCLGHFVFIDALLDFIKTSANDHGEARITITSSSGYRACRKLDYGLFKSPIPSKKKFVLSITKESMKRYVNTKLGILYIAMELDRRLRASGVKNVRVNAVHPGNAARTNIGVYDQHAMTVANVKTFKKIVFLGFLISHSNDDAAKTQTYLSANSIVSEEDIHGQFWAPRISWKPVPGYWMRYQGCNREDLKPRASNPDDWSAFWTFCEDSMTKVIT